MFSEFPSNYGATNFVRMGRRRAELVDPSLSPPEKGKKVDATNVGHVQACREIRNGYRSLVLDVSLRCYITGVA